MKIRAVKAYSLKGKMLVFVIRTLAWIFSFFMGKKWEVPMTGFEENPANMSNRLINLLYFAYKYYFRPHIKDDTNGQTELYFKNQTIDFSPPQGFCEKANLTINAGGDLMPYEWIRREYCENLWDDIGKDFFDADIVFANLETPVDTSQPATYVPEVMLNDMLFNADQEMFSIFNGMGKYKGLDIVSTANNHGLDMEEAGVINTIEFLNKQGIAFTGTARNEAENFNFPILERNGIRVAFLAYTFSLNTREVPQGKNYLINHIRLNVKDVDLSLITKHCVSARQRGADFVVASLHFGNAYQCYPSKHIMENAHRVFDECGVDLILGGHPHNIQPMERYEFVCPFSGVSKQGFIIYSLADFIACDIFTWCHLPVYLKLNLKKGTWNGKEICLLTNVEAVPVYTCATYKSSKQRSLYLLNAASVQNGQNEKSSKILSTYHRAELNHLLKFYNNHFNNFRSK